MSSSTPKSKPAIGFLTVVEHQQHGLFGGYLILNASGRPLEFHCTTPIKPNRAQTILYGPTLEPFLYGEQIGKTLIDHAGVSPMLICTDRAPALSAREYVDTPLLLILPPNVEVESSRCEDNQSSTDRMLRLDQAHLDGPRLVSFSLGRNRAALPAGAEDDRRIVTERMTELAESFDLFEPFQRIRDAIEEAQQAVR